jgi:hypothetical protein
VTRGVDARAIDARAVNDGALSHRCARRWRSRILVAF